jgi:tryptophan synthase alpha subunit
MVDREGNPVVAGFGSNRPAMIARKAGAAAVGVMVGLNAALAAAVAHNAQVNGRR